MKELKDQKIKKIERSKSKDQKVDRLIQYIDRSIYRLLDLSTSGCCQGKRARKEGGQEVALSQGALTGEAGHC